MKRLLAFLFAGVSGAQTWVVQSSNSAASLRGVSALNAKVVWASGTGGTYLRTTDGGATWQAAKVAGAESLDFRGIRAMDERTVFLVSSGSGDKSRIYKTTDGGAHWTLQFTNSDPRGFWDAIAFWDAQHGIVVGDPLDGHAEILTTRDGGRHWTRQPTPTGLPKNLPNEGSFAASNTCLTLLGKREAWFATGGPGAARVFHSQDAGHTWTVAATPIRNDSASAGIFSLAFAGARHGIAVGGDYSKDQEDRQNLAITDDGGNTWKAPAAGPRGFRSAVAYLPGSQMWVVTGTSGSDVSTDGGNTWRLFDSGSYNAMSFAAGDEGWAVGARGRIARFQMGRN